MEYDDGCPQCGDTNASVEDGYICIKCNAQYGICKYCDKRINNMIFWGCFDKILGAIPAVLTNKEKRVINSTHFDESEEEDLNDSDNDHFWYRPPYIPCENNRMKYTDDSTLWIFNCDDCNKHTIAHCD